jgi:hypothetical protein
MANGRSGAPTFALLINKACKLSHNRGFTAVLQELLGADFADIWAAWQTFCALWETFLGQDDYPFETDFTSPIGPGDPS